MANAILNFHFDFPHTSLIYTACTVAYMDQFLQDGENGQNVAFFLSFLTSAVTKRFDFFNFSTSTVLKRFCPGDSKNVFVLVLAHLETELELFEVWDIMVQQIIITIIPKLQTALARVLDEL